jgi:hypothetical protein
MCIDNNYKKTIIIDDRHHVVTRSTTCDRFPRIAPSGKSWEIALRERL